jgi:hypothetical protein
MDEIKILKTWAGTAEFGYSGSVSDGTEIALYGTNRVLISASNYESMLEHFRGCTVDLGTSFKPPGGSVGIWLVSNVTRTKIASRAGAILIRKVMLKGLGNQGYGYSRRRFNGSGT